MVMMKPVAFIRVAAAGTAMWPCNARRTMCAIASQHVIAPTLACPTAVHDALVSMAREREDESPFFVIDLGAVREQHKLWRKHLPSVRPFYAVKCNPDDRILSLLSELGTGFDCASVDEIQAAMRAGACPTNDIVYANPCKAASHLRFAADRGVKRMTLDCVEEVEKVAAMYPTAECLVRLRVDDSSALCKLGNKYGAGMDEVPHILRAAVQRGVSVVGVCFHVGSGCNDTSAYVRAVRDARHAVDLAADVGINMSVVDIGGGFPGDRDTFAGIANVLASALDHEFSTGVELIAEPGRFYVEESHVLAVNVIGTRRVSTADDSTDASGDTPAMGCDTRQDHNMVFVSDGLYGCFKNLLCDHATAKPAVLVRNEGSSDSQALPGRPDTTSVWGPTCDGLDCIVPSTPTLPPLRTGDWLAFERWGAYTISTASTFNGFPLPDKVYVDEARA